MFSFLCYTTHVYSSRIILLADLDCFFVEVERLHRPDLRSRPVVIGGEPGKRGVVAACSYEARALGIRSALPMAEAYRRAKGRRDVAFLHHGLHGNYTLYSRRVQDILRAETPAFRAKSIDEFEMDVSGCERLFGGRHGGIVEFAEHLRARVLREVGLKVSVGIGPSRIVAKMASRHAKPDGVFRVLPHEVERFLAPHDVQDVPGIGPATSTALRARGVHTVGQLLELPPAVVGRGFDIGISGLVTNLREGDSDWQRRCEGLGAFGTGDGTIDGPARRRSLPKSIGHETTFERDIIDPAVLEQTLWRLTEDACRRMREQDLRARHVTVRIRYNDFKTLTHGGFIGEATDADSAVFKRVLELFHEAWTRRLRIRLVGVRLSQFAAGASQLLLFATPRELREQRLCSAVDNIRTRYGRDGVLVGPGVSRIGEARRVEADSTAGIQTGFMPMRG